MIQSQRCVKNIIGFLWVLLTEFLLFIWISQCILEMAFVALFSSPQGSRQKFSTLITRPPLSPLLTHKIACLLLCLLNISILWNSCTFSIPYYLQTVFKSLPMLLSFSVVSESVSSFLVSPFPLCSLIQKPFYPLLFWVRNYARN